MLKAIKDTKKDYNKSKESLKVALKVKPDIDMGLLEHRLPREVKILFTMTRDDNGLREWLNLT
jgi:DNA-directed RNA polymerase subunit E'/Rpb7